jgi:bifunctional DNase/RNase
VGPDDEFLKQVNEHFRGKQADVPGEEAPPEEVEARRDRELNEKEVRVVGVCQAPHGGAFVLLRDSIGRNLPIWIDETQALSIHLALEGNTPSRPMTHDLMKLLVERLGGSVEYILVDDLYNNVYYAKLEVKQGERTSQIDCRPSDAIAVAVRFKVPIYVADHVLEEGQVQITEE